MTLEAVCWDPGKISYTQVMGRIKVLKNKKKKAQG